MGDFYDAEKKKRKPVPRLTECIAIRGDYVEKYKYFPDFVSLLSGYLSYTDFYDLTNSFIFFEYQVRNG
jgi:hypothetical protein